MRDAPFAPPSPMLDPAEPPAGSDRRAFMMRSAMMTAIVALGGCANPKGAQTPAKDPPIGAAEVDPNLDVVRQSKGPVMTLVDEFYKVGPGPSSSHTIGPMRITYDFYQRASKLPADQLAQATAMRVNLFGSLSATGKGHGTERAALAGIVGKEPATVDPAFLDGLAANPNQVFPVKL
ncbi:MAG: serine dehydratase beta chain, partial [Allosphingosinicella sp.]